MIFLLITALAGLLSIAGLSRPIAIIIYFCWSVIIGVLSWRGFFLDTGGLPPRMLLVIIPAIIFVVYMYKSAAIRSRHALIAIHILRIPVELTLFHLFHERKVPEIMTFCGWNYDILMGISAIFILCFRVSNKWFRGWNIAGIIFLGIIVMTAILAAPSPIQRLAFDEPNIGILEFPYTLLPGVVVPLVLLSHLKLIQISGSSQDSPAPL